MKLLFICSSDVNKKSYGGSQCTNRNYLSFCELFGKANVEVINLTSGLQKKLSSRIPKWLNYLRGFSDGLSEKNLKRIIILSKKCNYIFIDSSEYGVLSYYLRKKKINKKVICFFHNIEHNVYYQKLKNKPLSFWRFWIAHYNEKKGFKYSDKIVVLNKRDSHELISLYGRNKIEKKIYIIPISLSDVLLQEEGVHELTSVPPTCIFIGHNWYANIHGIKWFINNVLDNVNIKLQIIGNDMDKLRDEFRNPKIEFLGFVPDISMNIKNADYMISPIFKGGGMKVKTCEALMYGKNIIGTKEAFEGYELDYRKVGVVCNTKEEFIETINNYCSVRREKFNKTSRNYFLQKYSFEATLANFRDLL